MDYEKKYKDALERARDYKNNIVHKELTVGESIMDYVFPELKESEDERTRKELLEHCINRRDGKQVCVDASDYRRWADWLEKQDPKKHEEELEKAYKTADKVQYRRGYEAAMKEMEKQGETYTKRDVADLNEFVKEYSFNIPSDIYNLLPKEKQSTWINEIENAIKAGAQWQKEQMEKKGG